AGHRRLLRAAGQRRGRAPPVPPPPPALRQPLAPGGLPRRPGGARGGEHLAGAGRGPARGPLDPAPAPGLVRATYRLPLRPYKGFPPRARGVLSPPPAPQARRGSTPGYGVPDPRRISEDLGGEAAFRELAGAGLAVLLDIVPNHMAASDQNPFWADERLLGGFFELDPETRPPAPGSSSPPRGPRACARRTQRSSRRPTPWSSAWSPRASWTGCASTTPTASPTRPSTCAASPTRGPAGLGGEDPGAGR